MTEDAVDSEDAISKCKDALAETRAYVRKHAPYVARTIRTLAPYFAPGLGTLGVTEKMTLIIDPEWFSAMPLNMRGGCLMHEVGHIARGMDRLEELVRRDNNPELVNKAFDIPINDDLRKVVSGSERIWDLPDFALYSSTYKFEEGLTGEQYYELLKNLKEDSHKSSFAGGQCGSCAGGSVGKELEAEADAAVGRTPADVRRVRKQLAEDVKRAKQEKNAGTMPGFFDEVLNFEGAGRSAVPWRAKLRRVLRLAMGNLVMGGSDLSLARPSKSSYIRGILRPGLIHRTIDDVLFVDDTSGSVSTEALKIARIEAIGAMEALGIIQAYHVDVDSAVQSEVVKVRTRDLKKLPVHGRGGTSFKPAFALAEKMRPRPRLIIYFTDGYGDAPETPPKRIETVWALVGEESAVPAPWGIPVWCRDEADKQ